MNKRCIVNVATGEFYCKQQLALRNSARYYVNQTIIIQSDRPNVMFRDDPSNSGIDLILWHDLFPAGKTHEESPYGFKLRAIKAAYKEGRSSILWVDSPASLINGLDPIFEKIEKHGYYAMSHHDPLENWVGDTALKRFGMTREQLKGFHLPSGSCYGFDLSQAWVRRLFDMFCQYEEEGLFKSEVIGTDKWHRHDEAILALLLIQHSLPVFFNDPLFQSDSPECVIRSGANWTQDAKVYGG